MRPTVTLDDDVVAALRTAMRERGVSFKEALNSAVRSGLSTANPSARPYRVKPFAAEIRPGVDITKINRLLADWEDEEIRGMTWTDLSRAVWRKSSRSGGNGGTEDCVEVAALDDGRIAVRDSKRPNGAVLFFTYAQLAAWISGVKNTKFDGLS